MKNAARLTGLLCALALPGVASAIPVYDTFGPLTGANFGGSGIPNDSVAISSQFYDGNNLIIQSGGSTIEIPNVESASFEVSEETDPITVGDTITLSLRFGPDGITSGGLRVNVDCVTPYLTTTTTTVATTTTEATTSTTAPEPLGPEVSASTTSTTVAPSTTSTTTPAPLGPVAPVAKPAVQTPSYTG